MTRFLLPHVLCLCSFTLSAQPDTLKPIDVQLTSKYGLFGLFIKDIRVHYVYDGANVRRVKDFERYIRASGDESANDEFNEYVAGRRVGLPVYIVGLATVVGGLAGMTIAAATDPSGQLITQRTSTFAQVSYGFNRGKGGLAVAGIGTSITAWGLWVWKSGDHLRQSVRYYNRAVRQRRVAWQVTPAATFYGGGIRIVGRF